MLYILQHYRNKYEQLSIVCRCKELKVVLPKDSCASVAHVLKFRTFSILVLLVLGN